jgi:cytochrome b
MTESIGDAQKNSKLIWDLPLRIFHWLLAGLVCFSWYCVEISGDMDMHFYSGYTILTLLIFRITWGFAGTRYARFTSFIFWPSEIVAYAKTLFSRDGGEYAGHNPLGSLAVFALLSLVLLQAVTGLFATDDYYVYGPLNELVSSSLGRDITDIHYANVNILIGLIALHIVAALFYTFYKRSNLIKAMLTGRKDNAAQSWIPIEGSRLAIALVIIAIAGLVVYGIVSTGSGF